MKNIRNEERFCIYCMEKHVVEIVKILEREVFKGKIIEYEGIYQYCPVEDTLLETEEMLRKNGESMRKEYEKMRKKREKR